MSGFSTYAEQATLDHVLGVATFTAPAGQFVQLHTADPGNDGTANVAGNATRKAATFGAATGTQPATAVTTADLLWSTGEVTTSEDYTYFSLWSAVTAGDCLLTGTVTADAVTAGNEFKIPAGDLSADIQ